MKNIFIISVCFLFQPFPVSAGGTPLKLSGYVSVWTQDCSGGGCQLPVAGQSDAPLNVSLSVPSVSGQASAVRASLNLALPGGARLPVEMDFYAVCPSTGDACPGRYFQVQVSLSGPARAFCASSLNAGDFLPFPVVMCAGISADGRRYGVTLHRRPFAGTI